MNGHDVMKPSWASYVTDNNPFAWLPTFFLPQCRSLKVEYNVKPSSTIPSPPPWLHDKEHHSKCDIAYRWEHEIQELNEAEEQESLGFVTELVFSKHLHRMFDGVPKIHRFNNGGHGDHGKERYDRHNWHDRNDGYDHRYLENHR